jgi:hypothetical protein
VGLAAGAMYMVALAYPDQLDIIGVAEPVAIRNERYSKNTILPMQIVLTDGKMFLRNQNLLMR